MYKLTEISNYTTDVKFFIFLIADESGPFFVHILKTFFSAMGGIFILKWPEVLVIGACNGAPYLSCRLKVFQSKVLGFSSWVQFSCIYSKNW
jgi:hypothetical protein